jgi:hypothetical protein
VSLGGLGAVETMEKPWGPWKNVGKTWGTLLKTYGTYHNLGYNIYIYT